MTTIVLAQGFQIPAERSRAQDVRRAQELMVEARSQLADGNSAHAARLARLANTYTVNWGDAQSPAAFLRELQVRPGRRSPKPLVIDFVHSRPPIDQPDDGDGVGLTPSATPQRVNPAETFPDETLSAVSIEREPPLDRPILSVEPQLDPPIAQQAAQPVSPSSFPAFDTEWKPSAPSQSDDPIPRFRSEPIEPASDVAAPWASGPRVAEPSSDSGGDDTFRLPAAPDVFSRVREVSVSGTVNRPDTVFVLEPEEAALEFAPNAEHAPSESPLSNEHALALEREQAAVSEPRHEDSRGSTIDIDEKAWASARLTSASAAAPESWSLLAQVLTTLAGVLLAVPLVVLGLIAWLRSDTGRAATLLRVELVGQPLVASRRRPRRKRVPADSKPDIVPLPSIAAPPVEPEPEDAAILQRIFEQNLELRQKLSCER